MCVPIIGEPKAGIAREDDAVDLHERHAPRHMPWILDGHVVTRGEVTGHHSSKPGHARGIQGSMTSRAPRTRSSRMALAITLYDSRSTRPVVLDAGQQSRTPAGFGFLGGRQARGVLFEALDAEELGADRLLERFSGDQRDVVNGGARMA